MRYISCFVYLIVLSKKNETTQATYHSAVWILMQQSSTDGKFAHLRNF